MKSITILSKNQLNLNFWNDYLALDLCDHVVQYQDEDVLQMQMKEGPTFLLVDSYFHEDDHNALVSQLEVTIAKKGWNTTLVHLSPRFAGEYWSEQCGVVKTNLNTDLINYINAVLIQQQSAAA